MIHMPIILRRVHLHDGKIVGVSHEGIPETWDPPDGTYVHLDDILKVLAGYSDQIIANGGIAIHVDALHDYFKDKVIR